MHYLGLALYAEGATDYYFLRPLLLRLCADICAQEVTDWVEFSEEVIALNHPQALKDTPREQRIVAASKQALGAWRIVFVHTDGAGDPARARQQLAQPAIDLLQRECSEAGVGVAVIPVRETEAWAIADGDAVREVFGTTLTDVQLGLPRTAAAVESILDPKVVLNAALDATNPSPRTRRRGASPMLNALGESVSLQRLRQLSGFQVLEAELRQALRHLNILR